MLLQLFGFILISLTCSDCNKKSVLLIFSSFTQMGPLGYITGIYTDTLSLSQTYLQNFLHKVHKPMVYTPQKPYHQFVTTLPQIDNRE